MRTEKFNTGLALLRIWMSFEVVMDHFMGWGEKQGTGLAWFYGGIAVPVFMLLSFSLTDMERTARDTVKARQRLYRLVVPQIFWTVVYFAVYRLMDRVQGTALIRGVSDFWWQLFLGHSINVTVWYQVDLIILTIFFLFLFRFLRPQIAMSTLSISGMAAIFLQYSGMNGNMFADTIWPEGFPSSYITYPVGRLCEMMPYAVIGVFMCRGGVYEKLEKRKRPVIIVALYSLFMLFNFQIFTTPSAGYGYAGAHRIAVGIMTVALFYCLPFGKLPASVKNGIRFVSQYTMGVYFIHRLVATVIYGSRLRSIFRMRVGCYDCVIIYVGSFIIVWISSKLPLRWIRVSMSSAKERKDQSDLLCHRI